MSKTQPREVWVQDRRRNTPAHRIRPGNVPRDGYQPPAYEIVCPPHIATGGEAVTRAEAASFAVHPCMKCFGLTPQDYPPPPPPAGDGRR